MLKKLSRQVMYLFGNKGMNFAKNELQTKIPNWHASRSGLPDFSWYNMQKWGKIYQMTIKYTKWP
jgi:hypothetical protein